MAEAILPGLFGHTPDEPRPRSAGATPADQPARDSAIDVTSSWIVQAPAGAGKTELLTERFLALLAVVDEPEEILAITFTRAATAEMRGRIVGALAEAHALGNTAPQPGERRTLFLARAALRRSHERGWQLLEQPHRLDVQTIDSLCMRLAHGQPLLARLGGGLEPTEQAAALYRLAAHRTLERLGGGVAGSAQAEELTAALRHLLLLRDNNLGDCERLLAGMLACREQWRHLLALGGAQSLDWQAVRAELEAPFAAEIERVLRALHTSFSAEPAKVAELLELATYACANGSRAEVHLLHGLGSLPPAHADFVEHWTCLRNFLLTKDGGWRRSISVREGFPPEGDGAAPRGERTRYKQRMLGLIASFTRDSRAAERLRTLLCAVASLPAPRYTELQWETLLSVFRVLRHAVAELHVAFAERDQVDFAELSIAAANVLDEEAGTRGLLVSEGLRHLLIDEFQDTSRRQHQLVGRLLREWRPGDGRTCFLVGDPMQSIYIFRQAEVELFGRVQQAGIDCGGGHSHRCHALTLSQNFRSHAGLVDPLNTYFSAIFLSGSPGSPPSAEMRGNPPGEVPFTPSIAAAPALPGPGVKVHTFFAEGADPDAEARERDRQTARVLELIEQQLPQLEAARLAGSVYRVAVLGRARAHLVPVASALRARGIPYRAIELETLAERQEILDLLSLLRALLHPADRIAWLSVLRAPWCGLTLADLLTLTGNDDRLLRHTPIAELIRDRAHLLSPDGALRLERVAVALAEARQKRFARGQGHSLAAWLERAWKSLGAPAYLKEGERENAALFFQLLGELPPDGIDVYNGTLDEALSRLCATPDPAASEGCGVQLMTIHKAKGLGFDVVIVPALERSTSRDGSPLITMLERAHREPGAGEAADELLVAPLGRHGEQHRTYAWVQAQRQQRQTGERKRLFYVACTRAQRELHLLGTATVKASGELKPGGSDSLLATAWPALGCLFAEAFATQPGEPEPGVLQDLAAGTLMPIDRKVDQARSGRSRLSRVPADFAPRLTLANVPWRRSGASTASGAGSRDQSGAGTPDTLDLRPLERPEGSFEQRARGNAVHAMLEFLSEHWTKQAIDPYAAAAPVTLRPLLSRVAGAVLRRAGLAPGRADSLAETLVPIVLRAAEHEEGRWILGPRRDARSEWSLGSWEGSEGSAAQPRSLRVDRVFTAGPEPCSEGSNCLWIIDYKTGAEPPGGIALEAYLEAQKEQWRPQLETYGAALRHLYSRNGIAPRLRYGLYFPELLRLKSW